MTKKERDEFYNLISQLASTDPQQAKEVFKETFNTPETFYMHCIGLMNVSRVAGSTTKFVKEALKEVMLDKDLKFNQQEFKDSLIQSIKNNNYFDSMADLAVTILRNDEIHNLLEDLCKQENIIAISAIIDKFNNLPAKKREIYHSAAGQLIGYAQDLILEKDDSKICTTNILYTRECLEKLYTLEKWPAPSIPTAIPVKQNLKGWIDSLKGLEKEYSYLDKEPQSSENFKAIYNREDVAPNFDLDAFAKTLKSSIKESAKNKTKKSDKQKNYYKKKINECLKNIGKGKEVKWNQTMLELYQKWLTELEDNENTDYEAMAEYNETITDENGETELDVKDDEIITGIDDNLFQ